MDGNSQQTAHNRQILQHHHLLEPYLLWRETTSESGMEDQGSRYEEQEKKQRSQSGFITEEHCQSSSHFDENCAGEQQGSRRHAASRHHGPGTGKIADFANTDKNENGG